MNLYEVLRRPVVTEKSSLLQERGRYVFEVARDATKPEIKKAVEKAFKVKVVDVHVLNVAPEMKRMGRRLVASQVWKKAIVGLEPGQKIQLFEGV